ncbi:MAG: hypothetical protein IME94_05545 [Proteobacteria bacterium]|nr:hypothetical protein [Pseudomonadota bacterium]
MMGYTVILEFVMLIITLVMKWSAKDDARQKKMLELVKKIDGQVISDTKFRSQYRKIIVSQLKEIDRLDAE